jgi:hypothetical protein
MFTRIRLRVTYANVIATLALFMALGGGAYAAFKVPNNSVGTKQLKKNAVNSAKVKNGSLLKGDFKAGQLALGQQGDKGDKGDKGDTGATGPSDAYVATSLSPSASVNVPAGQYVVTGVCFKSAASGATDLSCAIAAADSGGGATSNSSPAASYAPAGNASTTTVDGTATIVNAGGSITASGSGSTTWVSAIRVGALHGP